MCGSYSHSVTNDYTPTNSHPDAERDCSSDAKSHANCDTAAEPDRFADANGHTATDTDTKPNRYAFTDAGTGFEYLDAIAG